ncbi:hypothetical protein ACVRXY_10425 [Streptococcus merionis]
MTKTVVVWVFFDFICENPSRPGRGASTSSKMTDLPPFSIAFLNALCILIKGVIK